MKAVFAFVMIIVLGFFAQIYLPFWIIAILCFIMGIAFIDKTKYAVVVGFFSVFLLWGTVALVQSIQNDFILLDRMSGVLPISDPILLLLLTAFIGGLIGALSTTSGYFLQTINEKKRRRYS